MAENLKVELEEITLAELPQFTKELQEAFAVAVKEEFGETEPIPSTKEVKEAFHAPETVFYHLVCGKQRVGGVVLTIDEKTQHNSLDLFFIALGQHNRGLGLAAWQAIEAKYPDTVVWKTITPYFEERNIHFYVNKCGFHIVEFFNAHHLDPDMPAPVDETGAPVPGTEAYFRFEKVMK